MGRRAKVKAEPGTMEVDEVEGVKMDLDKPAGSVKTKEKEDHMVLLVKQGTTLEMGLDCR